MLVLVSLSFLIYLLSSVLISLYRNSGRNSSGGDSAFLSRLANFFSRRGQGEGKPTTAMYELVEDNIELGRPKIFDADDEDEDLGDAYWREGETDEVT
jgi:hypothetical protein